MTTWLKDHFQDATQARESIAYVAIIGGVVATVFLIIGTVLAL
jgi:hypothetical protein